MGFNWGSRLVFSEEFHNFVVAGLPGWFPEGWPSEFSVRWSLALSELEGHESLSVELGPEVIPQHGDDAAVGVEQVGLGSPLVVLVDQIGQGVLGKVDNVLGVSIVVRIQRLAMEGSYHVVSDNVDLVEASPEALGGWEVGNISKSENVLVSSVLKGSLVDIQHPS